MSMPEFRKDPLLDRWVIIAAERAKRPHGRIAHLPAAADGICPFCAGNESMTPPPVLVLPNEQGSGNGASWSVRVVPNKYPALVHRDEVKYSPSVAGRLFHATDGAGIHEVAIEGSGHATEMAALSESDVIHVLHAYQERMRRFRGDARWRYALIYKNQGAEAGATIAHTHSQITALPFLPKQAREEFDAAAKYHRSEGRCVYCDIIEAEKKFRRRIVMDCNGFVALCPFASRVAGETWILPERHASCFEFGARQDIAALAGVLRQTLIRLSRCFEGPPVNYVLHSNPLDEPQAESFHWHFEILPKLHHVAGFEWGTGCYMNPLPPEDAARRLREVPL